MNSLNSLNRIEKEDALDILDRTIGFVSNCDSKASITLGIFGVLLTIMFSSEGITELKAIIKAAISSGTCYGVLYSIILACAAISFSYGIFKLIQVLFPKTNIEDLKQEDLEMNSKIFFGGIVENTTYRQYKEKILNYNEDEYLNDIISQIYINSQICNKKFSNYKIGILTAILGYISFLAVWGIGIIIY